MRSNFTAAFQPNAMGSSGRGESNVIPFQQRSRLVVSDTEPAWLESTKVRLNDLVSNLEPNWDGYQGIAVNFLNAHFALNMLSSICSTNTPPPSLVPGNSGDLQIEWHTHGFDIELHIIAPNKVSAYLMDVGDGGRNEGTELELENDFTPIIGWIRAMMEADIAPKFAAS